MPIDPLVEQVIPLAQARLLYPRTSAGQVTHRSTIFRHTVSGCRGILLESLVTPRGRVTSREAVARFFQRLTDVASVPKKSPQAVNISAAEEAGKVLDQEVFRRGWRGPQYRGPGRMLAAGSLNEARKCQRAVEGAKRELDRDGIGRSGKK